MHGAQARELLRDGLLRGVSLLVAGATEGGVADAITDACAQLGASSARCRLDGAEDAGEAALAAASELGALDLLAVDGASLFASASGGEQTAREALDRCLQLSWEVTRAVAKAAFIDAGRPGRVVYVAPATGGGQDELASCARAARAGLENLARTLSIEWSRFPVTTVAIAPGEQTGAQDLAALCAYLASPAGAYFSGCLLDLSGR